MSYLDAVPNLGAQPSLKQLAYETLQRQIITDSFSRVAV